jgi:hypothetical protein
MWVSGVSRFDFAWLSEGDFRRLMPVCCPGGSGSNNAVVLVGDAIAALSIHF